MPNKHGYQHRGMSKPSASLQKQSSHLSSSSKSRIRQFNLFHRAKKNMENTNCCESEEEEDEFEFEAEEAFRIVTKGTEDKADEFDNDEFDEAFESFKVKEIDAVKVNQSAEVEKLTSSTSKSKKESSGNSGTGSKSCERKEVKVQISEVKENEIPKENESHAHGYVCINICLFYFEQSKLFLSPGQTNATFRPTSSNIVGDFLALLDIVGCRGGQTNAKFHPKFVNLSSTIHRALLNSLIEHGDGT